MSTSSLRGCRLADIGQNLNEPSPNKREIFVGGDTNSSPYHEFVRVVIQRVSEAFVSVKGRTVGSTGPGFLLLVAVAHADTQKDVDVASTKIAGLRVFSDDHGKMNLSIKDVRGSVLLVSQFTLYGSVNKGRRPSFVASAPGSVAEPLCDALAQALRDEELHVETGQFGANMAVSLVNDGPVTLIVETQDGVLL